MIVLAIAPSAGVAQDGTPTETSAANETATATAVATETAVVTETIVATETAIVTETAVATATITETATTTETTVATGTPTSTETATQTATPEPPALSYIVATSPDCVIAPDSSAAAPSGGFVDYLCTDRVAISGTNIAPAEIDIIWTPWSAVDSGWTVQMLPPKTSPDDHPEWTPGGQAESWFDVRQTSPLGAGSEPVTIDEAVSVQYRIRVHRAACVATPTTLYVDRAIAIESTDPNAVITAAPVATEPLLVTPAMAPVPDPSVAFDGPLQFGQVGVTADGPETTTRQGTLTLTVSNQNQTCGVWDLTIAAADLNDDTGAPLDGGQLVIVSIDNQSLPDGCDLTQGCDIATLTGGPDAPETRTIALGVELRLPEQPGLGSFTTSISAALTPGGAE